MPTKCLSSSTVLKVEVTLIHPIKMLAEGLVMILLLAGCASDVLGAQFCKLRCDRVSNVQELRGVFDPVGKPIHLDRGLCVGNYTVENGCEIPPQESCSRVCQTRATERVRYHGRHGPVTEEVIKSCFAPQHNCLSGCELKPHYIFMFTGSQYQRRVNVGKCVGPCTGADMQCLPTRNHSEAVQGPNGVTTLTVFEKCSCVDSKCYKADYFESFTEQIITPNKNETKTAEKLINVGRCIGSCPGVSIPTRCYPSNENCLLRFGETPGKCVPTEGREHTFVGSDSKERTVAAVVTCGCSTG